ncbi:RNA polymerase sigma factor [Paenibacillus apis]|uniref:RNA polymerase sigma-70 region 2 domain-containing protein n=1 Tax=Paenibacillus apis TaxID=1792174 RepID=A0A920CMM1_9BACL|nr:sigma-70 family RNA polymerase sigma factor [Paenibacillus apis]GIO42748.1 hypothetical protein J41TS4_25060 [Paenibacillus apis]
MEIDELIELVELHGKAVYGFCYNLTRNKEDADDLYQDTFLKAAELRHKMDMSGNPKAFLISFRARVRTRSVFYISVDKRAEALGGQYRNDEWRVQ